MSPTLVILLRADDYPTRWLGVSLALTAAAHGDPVVLALFGSPLRDFVAGRFDGNAPARVGEARVGSLAGMLEEARRDLGVRVATCDTAARLEGLDPGGLAGRLELIGLPALWKEARAGRLVAL